MEHQSVDFSEPFFLSRRAHNTESMRAQPLVSCDTGGQVVTSQPFWAWRINQLGGGFKYVLFSSLFGEDEPILTIIFFRRVGSTTNQSKSSRVVRDDMFGAMPFNASLKWENTPLKFKMDPEIPGKGNSFWRPPSFLGSMWNFEGCNHPYFTKGPLLIFILRCEPVLGVWTHMIWIWGRCSFPKKHMIWEKILQ